METKLVARFETEEGKRFAITFNNPKPDLTTETVEAELQKIIDLDVLSPSQGKPTHIYTAQLIETKTTELI